MMKVLRSLAEAIGLQAPVATIGNFDGLHRGHREIIERVLSRAHVQQGTALLITFEPHPLKLLAPERAPSMLVTPEQKLDLLSAAGLDVVLILAFTPELAALTAERFVADFLSRGVGAREVYVGENFNFGRGRTGNADLLVALCASHGIRAAKVPEVCYLDSPISSSRIRRALRSGEVELARELLGRPHAITGTVVRGAGRGSDLGFPTANLAPHDQLVPQDGVYVTLLVVDGQASPSVTNIGSRPTFAEGDFTIETHRLDGTGDLYGRDVEVRFLARLRPELKFESVEALVRQVRADVKRARAYFRDVPGGEGSPAASA
jgi:riboflavin kinase/FMN adenylyltransferase